MNPRWPIYIISKGRWESRLTVRTMEEIGVPYHVVIEPQEYDQYAAVIDPKKIYTLPFSNLGLGGIPARNWVWDHAQASGVERHWIMDDNIRDFFRYNRGAKIRVADGTILKCAEDFVDRYENVALAGLQYEKFCVPWGDFPAYILNTRIYSCILIKNDLPYRWRGRYNEDADLSLRALKDGWCTIEFMAFLQGKAATMVMKGGNTDELYQDDGRKKMADALVELHPDVTKVVWKFNRWQHQVDYSGFRKNKLIRRPGIIIPDGVNEYGMKLVEFDKRTIRAQRKKPKGGIAQMELTPATGNVDVRGMDKKAWLATRHSHIGGSEIGAVLGLNKYKTALQLYNEKIAPEAVEIEPSPKMLAGVRQEPLIAQAYTEITGNAVSSDGLLRVHPDYPFCSVSLDRVIADKGDGRGPGVLECKNTTSMFASTWEQDVPLPYYCQTQWGMFVSGFKWGAICVQIDGWDIRILPVERDDDFIVMMLAEATEFWKKVESRTPPDPTPADVEKMAVEAGKQVQVDQSISEILTALAKAKADIKAAEDVEEQLTDALKLKIGNAEAVVDGEKVLVAYKLVNVKESFRAASSYRRLDIKRIKR